ncbi:MAG: hypothetical protein ACLFVU_11010 [Phycisphaerae bacterium]
MSKAIAGIFERGIDATAAVDALVAKGVADNRISVLATEETAKKSLAVEKQTKGAEGTAVGGGIGAAAGAIIAGLTAVGTLATGGAGLVVAGPLVAAFTGAGAGAITGGVLGGLIGLGFTEHEVKHFEDALDKGSVIVAVDTEDTDDEDTVKGILKDHNAKDVSSA